MVGGGIVGCSTAYHLSKLGVTDVVLIERKTLTSGTTWHAAGVVGSLRPSILLTKLTVEAGRLFPALEAETGQATGYRRTGGLSLAQTPERLEELKRIPGVGAITGFEAEMLTPSEVRAYSPNLQVEDLAGGVWIPGDGQTNPTDTTMAYAKGARQNGVTIVEQVTMLALETHNGRVSGIQTSRGRIGCETVVLCSGMWTRHLGRSVGVPVPLQAVEHMYIVTEPMDDVPPDQPFVRDFDSHIYIKGDAGKLLIGSIDPVARPWSVEGIPQDCEFTLLPEDWEHFEPFMEAALRRVPSLADAGIRQFLNGPESFTVDARHIMGEAPGIGQLFVAAGFNTTGIMSSAGVGKAMAEWIVGGEAPMDLWEVDLQRFEGWAATDRFIRERSLESEGLAFAMHWPYRQHETARDIKHSPVHAHLVERRACFGVVAGWERPLWYAPSGVEPVMAYSHGPQAWWPHAAEEARATREQVAIYDQSQMATFELAGADAERVLQRLCANDVAVAPGRVVYTQMLNKRGGIETDVTVSRRSESRYWITTGAPLRVRDFEWIRSNLPDDANVVLSDLTGRFAIFSIMGPQSRALLQSISSSDLSAAAFPFACMRDIEVGSAMVQAQRLSFVGELGYELFVPTEQALRVYEDIVEAGEKFGLRHAGLFCLDCCRLEKGFKHWGHDLSPSISPLEAGLGFAVSWDQDFIGRDALLRQREADLQRRIVLFHVEQGEPLLLHDEPIYRDDVLVGETTSGNRALTIGGSLCLGLVAHEPGITRDYVLAGRYEIQVGDRRYDATPRLKAPHDPAGSRLRG